MQTGNQEQQQNQDIQTESDQQMVDQQENVDPVKMEALDYLEKEVLKNQQYLFGSEPSLPDKELFEILKQFKITSSVQTESQPCLYAWNHLIGTFDPEIRVQWPELLENQSSILTSEKFKELITKLKTESTKQGEDRRDKQKWDNYVPPKDKRPADEFFDLTSIFTDCIGGKPIDISDDLDEGMLKFVMTESQSKFKRNIEEADIVYYTCETRFDNGQLVDFNEKRKAKNKFDMSDQRYHEHLRKAFNTMRKGEVVWIKYSPKYHKNIYHNFCKNNTLHSDQNIGDSIFIKLNVDTIKRSPPHKDQQTYDGKLLYFSKIREICKELMMEEEYVNAKELYSRCLGEFKNMPKKIRDSLTEDQKEERNGTMLILNLNLSLCYLKRNAALDAIKHAKEAVKLDPKSSKAQYRLSQSYQLNNDLEPAQEHLKIAMQLEPNDRKIRKEYQELSDLKNKKEKQWYSAMSGFYNSDKLKNLEQRDENENKLLEKVKRKHFGDSANPNKKDQDMDNDDGEHQKAEIKIRSRFN